MEVKCAENMRKLNVSYPQVGKFRSFLEKMLPLDKKGTYKN